MNEETFQNSKEAYEWTKTAGVLSESIAETFKAICEEFPANQTMIHVAIVKATGRTALQKYSVSPRFAVLMRMGLITISNRSACPVTGRTTAFYSPTLRRPTCTEAEAAKAARTREDVAPLKARIRELEDENRQLRELLEIRSASHKQAEERIRVRQPIELQSNLFPE